MHVHGVKGGASHWSLGKAVCGTLTDIVEKIETL